ncbi:MAG: CGNR zinc finger domain-containing protein [Acidobacteriota bacterium]
MGYGARPKPIADIRLVGGRPALDFVNTIHDRKRPPHEDYLASVQRYLEWAQRAGVLGRNEASRITASAAPASLLLEVRRFREHIHALFVARRDGRRPDQAAVAHLDAWLQKAWRSLAVHPGTADRLVWRRESKDVWLPLKRLALDALDLLQHTPTTRLKECAATDECGWLFLDDSKNNTRRWCSMDSCGALAKMRRYRTRTRAFR